MSQRLGEGAEVLSVLRSLWKERSLSFMAKVSTVWLLA